MPNIVSDRIVSLLNIGITETTSAIDASRIQIANSFILSVSVLVSINVIANLIEGDTFGLIIDAIWIGMAVVIPIANYHEKYHLNFHFILLASPLMIDFINMYVGPNAMVSPVYIVILLTAIFFFEDTKNRIFYLFYILINFGLTQYYIENYPPLVESSENNSVHYYFLFSLFATSVITMKMLNQNKRQLQKTQALLKELEAKNQEIERFTFLTSHDLKEPLRNISNFADLLKRELSVAGNEKNQANLEYLNYIKSNSLQLNSLVEGLHDFMSIEQENQQIEKVNLRLLLEHLPNGKQLKSMSPNSELIMNNLPTVCGYPPHLFKLFYHLIDNGFKFNEQSKPTVHISVEEKPDAFYFTVVDNGIGIEETYWKHIFEPFRKLHTKSNFTGPGIGLSICEKIVEQHGGSIQMKSEMGKGSTVSFSISK